MAGKQFPLYTDGVNMFTSFDGGATFLPLGGETATGNASAPISGNGLVATPFTIADAAITNAKLLTPPQDPAAVAITGGSATGMSLQGFTPTQLTNDLGFVEADWARKQYTTAIAAVPAFNAWKEIPLLIQPLTAANGAVSLDAGVEGGGIAPNNASRNLTGTVFQNMAGGNTGVFFRVAFGALGASVNGEVGVQAVDGTKGIYLGVVNATSGTNFVAQIFAAGNTNTTLGTADTNWHDVGYTDDGTTVKYWFDAVQVGSTATRSNISSSVGHQVYIYANTTGVTRCTRAMIFYVRP